MNMRSMIITVFFALFSLALNATEVKGRVLNSDGTPVDFANVILNGAADSTIVKLEYTNQDGSFSIPNVKPGEYWIRINYVGLADFNTEIFSLNNEASFEIEDVLMSPPSNELAEVTVTAKRPLLEMKADRMVFNVDGSINASGSDALELLRKAPGVMVDNNENVMLMGKSGVMIFIDGKPSKLSGDQLSNYLKTIPSSEIDNIEIITNPSSKYDAEGNAGIINIRFKKDASLGANGSLNVNYKQGETTGYGATLTGNWRNKKWNAFGNASLYDGGNINPTNIRSELNGVVYDQRSTGRSNWSGNNFKFGLDHFISDKSTVGVLLSSSISKSDWNSVSNTDIFNIGTTKVDSILAANVLSNSESLDLNYNLNYKYENADKKFNVDLDYGRYDNDSYERLPNSYLDGADRSLLRMVEFSTNTPTVIDIKTAKLDYEQNLGKGKLEVGSKVSEVVTKNSFDFYDIYGEEEILNIENSNDFDYTEMVTAAYVNYNTTIGKVGMQTGLRAEHTSSKGDLDAMIDSNDQIVERNYFDLFPSVGLTYTADEKNSFQFRYSRRLSRPDYQVLNPFRSRIDELTFEQGNPFLKPEYSHNITVSHSWNYSLNTSLSYARTNDLIGQLTESFGENTTVISQYNLESQNVLSLNISSPIPIKEWWNSYTSITVSHSENTGNIGIGKDVDLSVTSGQLYQQHTFRLPKGYNMELSGWYTTPGLWGANFKMKAMASIDLGVQKSFLDDAMKVKLSVSDILKTQDWNGESVLGDLSVMANGGWDSRKVKLSVTYNFGNEQVKSRKRKTGLEDEKSRIGGGKQ